MALHTGPETAVDLRFNALFDGIDTSRITVELAGHKLVEDYPRLLGAIAALRRRGIARSVDDSGSGYSGLSHIRQLLLDVIKLDRDLTAGINMDAVRRHLPRPWWRSQNASARSSLPRALRTRARRT